MHLPDWFPLISSILRESERNTFNIWYLRQAFIQHILKQNSVFVDVSAVAKGVKSILK